MHLQLQPVTVSRIRLETTERMVMRSNPVPPSPFIFQLENILRSNSKFSSSYGR